MDICDLKKSVNSDWYQDSKYDFFWNNYAYSMNHARNFYKETASVSKSGDFLNKQNKLICASKQASHFAHQSTLNAMKYLSLGTENTKLTVEVKKDEDNIEFEATEDMYHFYEESIMFKNKRDDLEKQKFKQLIEENKLEDINFSQGDKLNINIHETSKSAPLDRAGLKREEELKILYGEKACEIHLAETILQMKHDKHFDFYQPKYWPSFPLRVKFN